MEWHELLNVEESEIGQIAIFWPMGNTMAVGKTLKKAVVEFNKISDRDQQITEDDLTKYSPSATNETLCWTKITE